MDDWTVDPIKGGPSNSSPKYLEMVEAVRRVIVGDAHALLAGNAHMTAMLVMGTLAHTHGMAPPVEEEVPGPFPGLTKWQEEYDRLVRVFVSANAMAEFFYADGHGEGHPSIKAYHKARDEFVKWRLNPDG